MHSTKSIKPKDNLSVLKIMKQKDSSRALNCNAKRIYRNHKVCFASPMNLLSESLLTAPPHTDAGTCVVGQLNAKIGKIMNDALTCRVPRTQIN
jgi:hypothetical protein